MGSRFSKKKNKIKDASKHDDEDHTVKLQSPRALPQNPAQPVPTINTAQPTVLQTPPVESYIESKQDVIPTAEEDNTIEELNQNQSKEDSESNEETKEDSEEEYDPYIKDQYTPQPGFNNKILLYGFMRDIEKSLNGTIMRIIPDTIMQLCDAFYSTPNPIFFMDRNTTKGNNLYIVDLDDMDRELHKQHTLSYTHLNIQPTMTEPNAIQLTGIIYKSKIKVSSKMLSRVKVQLCLNPYKTDPETWTDDKYYDVIFKCGGPNGSQKTEFCGAYVWKNDDKEFEHIYNIRLPDNPYTKTNNGQSIVWSDKYQRLYCMTSEKLSYLSLTDWSWEQTNIIPFRYVRAGGLMSTVCVGDDYGEEKIFVIGGIDGSTLKPTNNCDLYDINTDEWMEIKPMKYPRCRTGLYHDKWTQQLFVCGGNGAERKVEYFDLNKNEWYFDINNIPYTKEKHNFYPIIWKKDGHMLYISSVKANAVEMIDLRQENREWMIVYDKLDPLFDTEIVWYKAANCRLIQ